MGQTPEILNAQEAAVLLHAHVETIRRFARRGEIPAFKVGKDWRFDREALKRWIERQALPRGNGTVLIVDDEDSICRVLSRMISRAGLEVCVAATGSEGLHQVMLGAPDLILLDLKMPDLNGAEFLAEVRKTHPDLPVVIVTGYPDSELMHQAMQFGPFMVLAKPVNQGQLDHALRIALGRATGQHRHADQGVPV